MKLFFHITKQKVKYTYSTCKFENCIGISDSNIYTIYKVKEMKIFVQKKREMMKIFLIHLVE